MLTNRSICVVVAVAGIGGATSRANELMTPGIPEIIALSQGICGKTPVEGNSQKYTISFPSSLVLTKLIGSISSESYQGVFSKDFPKEVKGDVECRIKVF
jgi:hypothetical protein